MKLNVLDWNKFWYFITTRLPKKGYFDVGKTQNNMCQSHFILLNNPSLDIMSHNPSQSL